MTYLQAALTILNYAERPLTVPELTAVAITEGLVAPRGKTPDRTMASVLYRRMIADPEAPIVARSGRFWLRERPLPAAEAAYLERPIRHLRPSAQPRHRDANSSSVRKATVLPAPPLRLPDEVRRISGSARVQSATTSRATRHERAIARAGERGARLLTRLHTRRAGRAIWDVAATAARLVVPLLAHLGYRAEAVSRIEQSGRGAIAYLLHDGNGPAIALEVRRLTHDLRDDDAWRALGHAREYGARFAVVTNGRELRLYAAAVADAQDSLAAALVLTLDLAPIATAGTARAAQEAALWLLSRESVASNALDAYALDRVVGRVLLESLDAADSPLARVLITEARARTGLNLPATLVLRHARLALRERRGRDGEALPDDIPSVAVLAGPRLEQPDYEMMQTA